MKWYNECSLTQLDYVCAAILYLLKSLSHTYTYSLTCIFRILSPETKHCVSSDGDEAEGAKLKDVEMTEHDGAYDMDPLKMEDDGETKEETKGDNHSVSPCSATGLSPSATMDPTSKKECNAMIVEARKAGNGRRLMKLMKMKKNLPDEAGAAPQAPPAVVPQPQGEPPYTQEECIVMIAVARKAKQGREVMRLMKLKPKLPKKADLGGLLGNAV